MNLGSKTKTKTKNQQNEKKSNWMGKIFANDLPNKQLISKYISDSYNSITKKYIIKNVDRGFEYVFFQRRYTDG